MYESVGVLLLFYLAFVAAVIFIVIKIVNKYDSEQGGGDSKSNALYGGISFKNIVLTSNYNTTFTEIDEVIVSPYGIFCIEYKAHVGFIFGTATQPKWTQCRYDGKRPLHNPIHQNYKHLKSLERALHSNIKAPIHSIVVFTNAKKVEVDSNDVLLGKENLRRVLANHKTPIYTYEEVHRMARTLAYAEQISKSRLPRHVGELQQHLAKAGV